MRLTVPETVVQLLHLYGTFTHVFFSACYTAFRSLDLSYVGARTLLKARRCLFGVRDLITNYASNITFAWQGEVVSLS